MHVSAGHLGRVPGRLRRVPVRLLSTEDPDGTPERLQRGDAEVVQEPAEQDHGVRDCAVRDPAGNLIRTQELR